MFFKYFFKIKFQLFLLVLLALGASGQAQVENRLTLTGTSSYSSSFSPAYEAGLMLGLRSNEQADFRLGLVYRHLLVTVNHPDSYLSLMAMGSR
ncbi:MAG TPA: hypothetical protein VGD90_02465, partial [Sphingobacteriaceae bacterium]